MKRNSTKSVIGLLLALLFAAALCACGTDEKISVPTPKVSPAVSSQPGKTPSPKPAGTASPKPTAASSPVPDPSPKPEQEQQESLPESETGESQASAQQEIVTPTPSPVPSAPPEPTEEPPEETACTLSVSCAAAVGRAADIPSDGWILSPNSVVFYEGETVFDVLQRACGQWGIGLEYQSNAILCSVYIEGIGGLYEFDCGGASGWTYQVNGSSPSCGCNQYRLADGDEVAWIYQCG